MPFPARELTHDGLTLPITEWAARRGLPVETIRVRINRLGWSVADALTTPSDKRFRRRGGRPRADVPRPAPQLRDDGTGRAMVRWRSMGRDHTRYFGRWGTPEAAAAYRRFAAEWATGAYDVVSPTATGVSATVADLILGWLEHCSREYRKGGKPTAEVGCNKAAMGPLNDLYGTLPAADFGPAQLRAVRAAMVGKGWARNTVNGHVRRVVRMFGWAVGRSMIPASVVLPLREVETLKRGREAPDRPRVKDVPARDITRTFRHLSPIRERRVKLVAMVRLQRLTGMRPGELCAMRPADVNRAGPVWVYDVPDLANKNLHRDKPQRYHLGPRAQTILGPYITGPADRAVFGVGGGAYALAVRLACRKAGVTPWHPHQLRHALASEVARRFGSVGHAAAALGDTPETAGRVYVHVDPTELAKIEVARTMG